MRIVLEMLVRRLARVPLRLEPAQRRDHPVGGVDGVGAGAHLAHMHRMAADLDLEPDHADIGAHELLLLGLGDQRGVGAVAAQMRHQRAVAGGFLLDHRLHVDGRGRLQPEARSASSAKRLAAWPAFMSPAPRPYIQSPSITGSKGGWRPHVGGPAGTTSTCACRISERPVSSRRTMDADDDRRVRVLVPRTSSRRDGAAIAARSIANRSMA